MELFTEEELATVVEQLAFESIFIRDSISRLVEHARELIRLKSGGLIVLDTLPSKQPRESGFASCSIGDENTIEEAWRVDGYEVVSSTPVVIPSRSGLPSVYTYIHFRKP